MPQILTTFHSYSTILFSLYGIFHVLHHFFAAVFYDTEWHRQMQDSFMLRGIPEKLLIWVPTGLSLLSGFSLLAFNYRQTIASWKWLFNVGGKIEWLKERVMRVNPKTGGSGETNDIQNIIHIQYISASVLGLLLCAHLPAVFALRFVFSENAKPLNIYGAAHAMHDSAMPWIARSVFKLYYMTLISSFFAHGFASTARWLIRRRNPPSLCGERTNWPELKNFAGTLHTRFVIPGIFVAVGVAVLTVVGIDRKTNEEICAKHFPEITW